MSLRDDIRTGEDKNTKLVLLVPPNIGREEIKSWYVKKWALFKIVKLFWASLHCLIVQLCLSVKIGIKSRINKEISEVTYSYLTKVTYIAITFFLLRNYPITVRYTVYFIFFFENHETFLNESIIHSFYIYKFPLVI